MSHRLHPAPPAYLAWGLRDVQVYGASFTLSSPSGRWEGGLCDAQGCWDLYILCYKCTFPPPPLLFPQGNPEQDANVLSNFTEFVFCFFLHNHTHWFLLVCRSCLQLKAQNTIYSLYGFLIWKWIEFALPDYKWIKLNILCYVQMHCTTFLKERKPRLTLLWVSSFFSINNFVFSKNRKHLYKW